MAGRGKSHPNKEIRDAIDYAVSKGWTVKPGGGSAHCWCTLRCPRNDRECRCGLFCQMSVWSTPRVPEDMAAKIRRTVDGCIGQDPAPDAGRPNQSSKKLKKPRR